MKFLSILILFIILTVYFINYSISNTKDGLKPATDVWDLGKCDGTDYYHIYSNKKAEISGAMNHDWPEIIKFLTNIQHSSGIFGKVGEIGVHEGLFFGALWSTADVNEEAWACDLFDLQNLNFDQSGKGDLVRFRDGLRLYKSCGNILIISGDSTWDFELPKSRMISVDGGHSLETCLSDLCKAKKSLMNHGLIFLDDYLNPDWMAVHQCVMKMEGLSPVAYFGNKLILCLEEDHEWWISRMNRSFSVFCPMKSDVSRRMIKNWEIVRMERCSYRF